MESMKRIIQEVCKITGVAFEEFKDNYQFTGTLSDAKDAAEVLKYYGIQAEASKMYLGTYYIEK